jgi:hypothetical protein
MVGWQGRSEHAPVFVHLTLSGNRSRFLPTANEAAAVTLVMWQVWRIQSMGLRTVSGPARRALNARDGHCRWPGDRPAKWSAAHHVVRECHPRLTEWSHPPVRRASGVRGSQRPPAGRVSIIGQLKGGM